MPADAGVCIVAPPERGETGNTITPFQREWVANLRKLADERNESVAIFRTIPRVSTQKGQKGRRFSILDPWEAERLYRLTHRGYSAVFQAGSARVLKNPTNVLESSNTISVEQLVQHKTFFAQFDGSTSVSDLLNAFDVWSATVRCEDHRDCRVLPLHMFEPDHNWGDLVEKPARDAFERVRGKPLHLRDDKARAWKQTAARHGQDTLTVANYELPTGFHWDVESSKNRSRMSSLTEVWRFDSGAYLNISPDGHARGGQSSGVSAVKEGTAPRPPVLEAPAIKKNGGASRTPGPGHRKHN